MDLKGGGVEGSWGKMHNMQFCDLYSSPDIMWVIK
jgi:hypothetical protein